jgi:hypothetical protein
MADTKGIDDAIAALNDFKKEWGQEFLRRVSAKTPAAPSEFEGSGKLRDSWVIAAGETEFTITNTATDKEGKQYWTYVEYGTEHMPAVGMLRTTIQESADITRVARDKAKL